MLIDVVPLVRDLVPGLLRHPRPSVVCVRTTHQKYLVFDGDASRPACVVEIGDAARLRRVDGILRALHARAPGLVPRPLACVEWDGDDAVQIQEGVAGIPWFRLADFTPTREAWRTVLQSAVAAMGRLHGAIASVPEWCGTVQIDRELCAQVAACRRLDVVPSRTFMHVEASARKLRGCVLRTICQHGDFSVNNLMVAPEGIAVLDFEEFGLTNMPLHDAFGLALSFDWSQNGRCPLTLAECLASCLAPAPPDADVTTALLLHHLLWRINRCAGQPARAGVCARLVDLLGQVCDGPGGSLNVWPVPLPQAPMRLPIPNAG